MREEIERPYEPRSWIEMQAQINYITWTRCCRRFLNKLKIRVAGVRIFDAMTFHICTTRSSETRAQNHSHIISNTS